MEFEHDIRVALTPRERYGASYSGNAESVISAEDSKRANDFVQLLPGYLQTPLVEERELAVECEIGALHVKHEGFRQPTESFKVTGPPYALARQLQLQLGLDESGLAQLVQGDLKDQTTRYTASAATSGNHGRALAWAAREFGCQCRIYMPAATGEFREQRIQSFGAETIRVEGTYDNAMERAVDESELNNYLLIGDGAKQDVLRHIIHGYSMVGMELVRAFKETEVPTHVFVPAGGGSLSSAVAAPLWMSYGNQRPRIIVVQPHSADSGYHSCLEGVRTPSRGDLLTVMDGLSVRELGEDPWDVLRGGVFAFITIADHFAIDVLRSMASRTEPSIGETGVSALAGLWAAAKSADVRRQLQLTEDSRVVAIATEGLTDPPVLRRLLS